MAALRFQIVPRDLRRLRELPALAVADTGRDVRGWEIIAHDGRTFGRVSDLLVDPDRLESDVIVVSLAEGVSPAGTVEALVPLAALAAHKDRRRLVLGGGLPPIKLRYRSAVMLAAWALAVAVLILTVAWGLGASCWR